MKFHVLVFPSMINNLEEILYFLKERDDDVNLILPDTKTEVKENEVLLLLDCGGLNATTSPFLPTYKLPPNIPPIDQWVESFRVNLLDYYLNRQKGRIAALGYSALMLYGHLGGKILLGESEFVPAMNKVQNLDLVRTGDRYQFLYKNKVVGVHTPTLTQNVYATIMDLFDKPVATVEDTDQAVMI